MSTRTITIAFIYFFLTSFSFQSIAQTEVSGGIFEPTTWTLAESPYTVTGDIVVFPGQSLTIEAGVEVHFQSSTKLELRSGSLYANGTADARILLTVDSDDPPNAEKWLGIVNTSPATDSIGVELSHITIEHAEVGMNYGSSFGYRTVSNAIFQFNDTGLFDGALGYNWVSVYDSDFLENGKGMEGRMSAYNCTFDSNEYGFANPLYFNNSEAGGEVINCTFTNNTLALGFAGQIITFARVENSIFQNNERAVYIYQLEANGSTFETSSDIGVYVVKGTTTNCTFRLNNIGLQVGQSPYQLNILANRFEDNTYGVWLDGPGAIISDNIICFNTLYDAYVNTTSPVNLSNNCWCTNDEDSIKDGIFDAFDDISVGIAGFLPFTADCLGNLVYPGDANNNGLANAWDILQLGLAYNSTGPERPEPSTDWGAQEAPDWPQEFINGQNYKYADADGNGIVEQADISLIESNYGQEHESGVLFDPVFESGTVFDLYLEAPDTTAPEQVVSIDVMLGFSDLPTTDLYGIAFALTYDNSLIEEGSFQLILNDSWLGDDLISVTKEQSGTSRFELGFSRKDQVGENGFGKIATIQFVMGEDIILLQNNNGNTTNLLLTELQLAIEDIVAMTSAGKILKVESQPIDIFITDTEEQLEVDQAPLVYPNPVEDVLFIQSGKNQINAIELLTIHGQKIQQLPVSNEIPVHALEAGIYILHIQTDRQNYLHRFVKQ